MILNISDDQDPESATPAALAESNTVAVSIALQLELAGLDEAEREAFCDEMGVAVFDRDQLVRRIAGSLDSRQAVDA